MKKLLSLPPNLVGDFHDITGHSHDDYFCTCDPIGHRLGSGGGTAWLLEQAYLEERGEWREEKNFTSHFDNWLASEKRILIHAGGQSRRLPSYAVQGKVLMPVPMSCCEHSIRLNQTLLDLQLPLYEQMMELAPQDIHTMVVSGDVYIRATQTLQPIPEADVVCYGLDLDASRAKNHGVFVSSRQTPTVLKRMLQKPSVETLNELQRDHCYLTDIGVWLLSDRAVRLLMKHANSSLFTLHASLKEYDLYGEFGLTLGTDPLIDDPELRELRVAILPLPGGEFYHFGTSREMISSTLILQDIASNQRQVMEKEHQPHPTIIIQNADCEVTFTEENTNIWIENSHVGKGWTLTRDNIVTGVPRNDWQIRLEPGECIDVTPVGDNDYEVRRYHIDEAVDSNALAERANLRRLFRQRLDNLQQSLPRIIGNTVEPQTPRLDVVSDQIVCGRSPVRIDIAGGWTDTPPYCLMEGGNVVNLAIELNGQPPLQVFAKPSREPHIVLRSIDLGATEVVETHEQLMAYNKVGSPFSIPKAALVLAGFGNASLTLHQQLETFGCGIELTMLSAIPAGSGLGTSSILAATVLGVLNDFCALGWDKNEIGHRTLMLEQMLTTGGGWQDQFGGIIGGVKLLQTQVGFDQNPDIKILSDGLWTLPEYAPCHLLYYTGITRTAKQILAEIVRRMFMNQQEQQQLLGRMKEHSIEMSDAIQRQDFQLTGQLVRRTWTQNQLLDSGTNPAEIAALTTLIDDLCLGYKLPGAGGGGYLYMIAKDPEAAARIKTILNENRRNANARFVDMTLSKTGLQISRS